MENAVQWKKCQAINLGSRTPTSHYKLGTSCHEWVKHTKYLGVIIQSDLKFDQHINDKCFKSRKLLGGIKHLMYDALKEARLLIYTSLCRPILEYAYVVWDPSAGNKINYIERVQNSAVCFISNLKGRTDSVSETRNQLQLQSLEERRKNRRLCFLTQILQNEDQHRTLSTTEWAVPISTTASMRSELHIGRWLLTAISSSALLDIYHP